MFRTLTQSPSSGEWGVVMETELVSKTSTYINYLRRLSAREHYLDFCSRENFKIYVTAASSEGISLLLEGHTPYKG
jgi:hypothetical protein